jgi:hypothetical protein
MSEKELGHQVVDEDHETQIHEAFTPSDKKETYILKATEDMCNGIIVDPTGLPKDIPTFVKSLNISLEFYVSSELMTIHVDYEILKLHDPDVALNNKLGFGCHFWCLNLLAYSRPAAVA